MYYNLLTHLDGQKVALIGLTVGELQRFRYQAFVQSAIEPKVSRLDCALMLLSTLNRQQACALRDPPGYRVLPMTFRQIDTLIAKPYDRWLQIDPTDAFPFEVSIFSGLDRQGMEKWLSDIGIFEKRAVPGSASLH